MTAELEYSKATGRNNWREKVDFLVAICALITSIASIWLSVTQGDDMQRLVQAQSWPFVGFITSNNETNPATGKQEPVITMTIENLGVGPAKIQSLEIFYKGKNIKTSRELLRACCTDASGKLDEDAWKQTPILTSSVVGRVLRAGQTMPFIYWSRPETDNAVWEKFNLARFEVEKKICYCSVFDECWTSDLDSTQATPVKSCPMLENSYRQ